MASARHCFNLKREAAPVATCEYDTVSDVLFGSFNLKREAAPVATRRPGVGAAQIATFQSQTRSRSGCHSIFAFRESLPCVVSISNEKPPRLPLDRRQILRPVPGRFNLKREAAPVATFHHDDEILFWTRFQSQTRSRPGCHVRKRSSLIRALSVSISNEKPPRLPPCCMTVSP